MKYFTILKRQLAGAALGLTLAVSTSFGQIPAQDISVGPSAIQPGGSAGDVGIGNWGTYWISTSSAATFSAQFDSTMHSAADIAGSIHLIYDWNGTAETDISSGATLPNGGGTWLADPGITVIDATKYADMTLDVYWATTNTTLTSWPQIGLATTNYGMISLTNNFPIPTTAGWQHLVIPIDPALAGLSGVAGISIYRWGGVAHAELWVDNVQLIARSVPVPPPTVALKKATPGFTMFADRTPNYNRQNLRTGTNANNNVTWVGRQGPVTYSMNVADFPDKTHAYFPLHITIAPGLEASSDPDWSAANCVFLEIVNQGDGSAIANFRYKTNQPGNNAMLFADGNLGSVIGTSPVGTWSLTFNQNTSVTVTAPGGATLQASLPPEVAALFTDPVSVYFGLAMGTDNNLGQAATFDHIQISGVANPIDEHFTTATLNQNIWSIHPQSAGSYQANVVAPPDSKFWLYWGLPANGFRPQASAVLGNPNAWVDATTAPTVQNGSQVWALVRSLNLPNPDVSFFSLIKATASQLQVLMPGETNAPGTATGKIGTPLPQGLGAPFSLVVNAVDSKWNIIPDNTDTVHLTSTDVSGLSFLPADAPMVKGTVTFTTMAFWDFGTFTVTASDVTTNTIAPNTGSPTPVPQ